MSKTLKWVFIAIALAVVANVAKESISSSKEVDARIAFEKSCARQARDGGKIPEQNIETVCSCTSEKAIKSLGSSKFVKVLNAGNDASESDKLALSSALIGCFQEHAESK